MFDNTMETVSLGIYLLFLYGLAAVLWSTNIASSDRTGLNTPAIMQIPLLTPIASIMGIVGLLTPGFIAAEDGFLSAILATVLSAILAGILGAVLPRGPMIGIHFILGVIALPTSIFLAV